MFQFCSLFKPTKSVVKANEICEWEVKLMPKSKLQASLQLELEKPQTHSPPTPPDVKA